MRLIKGPHITFLDLGSGSLIPIDKISFLYDKGNYMTLYVGEESFYVPYTSAELFSVLGCAVLNPSTEDLPF